MGVVPIVRPHRPFEVVTLQRAETYIDGLVRLRPEEHFDSRGSFMETYKEGVSPGYYVQDNQSVSGLGVVRGLHFQKDPWQAKLVRVAYGAVYDVAVDLRPGSKTFGMYYAQILDDKLHEMLYIPRGFAHGFQALIPNTIFLYKVDGLYNPQSQFGLHWMSPVVAGLKPMVAEQYSKQDAALPMVKDLKDLEALVR